MSKTIDLNLFTSAKNFKFKWDAPLHQTEVEIQIPDFQNNKFEINGDWGPMYHVALNAESPLQLSYTDLNSTRFETYSLEQRSFKMDSPMLFKIRKDYPFVISLKDERKGFDFHLFMNQSADLARVEVLRSVDGVKLFESDLL